MFVEICVISFIVVVLISLSKSKEGMDKKSLPKQPVSRDVTAPQPANVRRALNIPGAQVFNQDKRVLQGFGLSTSTIADIKMFKGTDTPIRYTQLPPDVAECIKCAYADGLARGIEISYFIAGKKLLELGDAIYMVLVTPSQSSAFIVSFISKAR